MTSTSKISVFFREFDVQGNCYADIILPNSGNRISGFKVKLGPGGGIMVHMPSGMGTTWIFEEIEWAEVRRQITEEYNRTTNNQPILVKLHHFDEKKNCLADIILRDSGVAISDFKVMSGFGGGIMVHMPSWMHTRWSYTEVQWSEVRQIVAREYLSAISRKEQSIRLNTASDGTQICDFYSSIVRVEASVVAIIASSNEKIQGIQLVHTKEKDIIQVFMPREMNYYWNNTCIEWDLLVEIVTNEYRRQVLGENCKSISNMVTIEFHDVQEVTTCMVDVKLPHKKNIIKGFRIRQIKGDEKIIISTPKWMGRWNDNRLSWYDLCALITGEYSKYMEEQSGVSDSLFASKDTLVVSESDVLSSEEGITVEQNPKQQTKEKNELGRIKNAENSSFVFYPRTVLRSVDSADGKGADSKKKLFDLVAALNKGSSGGIGPFEINILEWIAKLRYVSSTMLVDLIKAGYVSFGWRSDVTLAKLSKIINRMAAYDLITLTRFMTVNEDGSLDNGNYSVMRIITLGRNGSVLLHELGKNTSRYNAFDIFQDGNTVKRFLTANQWLIYWLKTYKEEIGEEYETNCIIHLKGVEYVGARIYATVILNNCPIVAEPVRRVEEFEIESNKQWLREKMERLSLMFDNLDQIYHGKDEISFSQRPVIVLVCEDDNHIFEVWESIKSILPEINNQEIWFSSDLRIFNYNKRGERFLRFSGDSPHPVDLRKALGIDNEAESKEKDDAARKESERRKTLADALRTSQPITVSNDNGFVPVDKAVVTDSNLSISDARAVIRNQISDGDDLMVNSEGTVVNPSEISVDSDIQINVSGSEETCGDSDCGGIIVPSEKLAGGISFHCRVCDNIVFSGAHFCPYCGSPVSVDKPSVKLQKVQFSAIAPKVLSRGEYSIINVIMYEESYRCIVDELINTMDEPAQETKSGVQKVSEGAEIKIILKSPDLKIEGNIENGIWQGEHLDFSFVVLLPEDFKKRQILFIASVYINDVIATKLKFIVKCSSVLEQKIAVSRDDVLSAFISYASQDRNRVAAIIQGMKKARPDLDVFFDVDSLRSGDDWETALHEEIERRDVLFLCWSHFARESKWVDAEWRYALEQKGADCIEPVPIESPDICPPPEELKYKHFNDKLLYIINAT